MEKKRTKGEAHCPPLACLCGEGSSCSLITWPRKAAIPAPGLLAVAASCIYLHLLCNLGGLSTSHDHKSSDGNPCRGRVQINRRSCICSRCFSDSSTWRMDGPSLVPTKAVYTLVLVLLSLLLNLSGFLFKIDLCSHSSLFYQRPHFTGMLTRAQAVVEPSFHTPFPPGHHWSTSPTNVLRQAP